MIAIAAGTSANNPFNRTIAFRPHRFILHFSRTSSEINEFMKTHVINLPENNIRQVDNIAHETIVTDLTLNSGCNWKATHLGEKFNYVFSKIVNTNCESICQYLSPTNYERRAYANGSSK